MISLSSIAIIRLSELTTEIGRVRSGVNAGPRRCDMLEGFLGRRKGRTSLKLSGNREGLSESKSEMRAWKRGIDISEVSL